MAEKIEEKRLFARIRIKTPIRYQVRGQPEFNNSLTNDISINGISFTGDKFIAPKTALDLNINLLSQILSPIGIVTWSIPLPYSNRYKIGIKFLELNPIQKNYLIDYIKIQNERKTE